MILKNQIVKPGFKKGTVITEEGEVLSPPDDWSFLPAGDGPLTLNVKKRGVYWQVQIKKGRRNISKGIWIKEEFIVAGKEEVEAKRATPEYARRRDYDKKRRDQKHLEYVELFYKETKQFLDFHPEHSEIADQLAKAVTELATPIGSGTVARTERIPLPERVQAAVIAWMRHQTTAYDQMSIARIKGKRREVRKMLAQRSKDLLQKYRSGHPTDMNCPLLNALDK